jgi:hypothetical protein
MVHSFSDDYDRYADIRCLSLPGCRDVTEDRRPACCLQWSRVVTRADPEYSEADYIQLDLVGKG